MQKIGSPDGRPSEAMRWYVLSLLFVASTINYLDRAILAVLLPEIRNHIAVNTGAYGNITFLFQISYALGSLACGRLLDKYGTKIGFGAAAALWSLAAALNAIAANALQFGLFRAILGFGESANFPACNKAAAELFPPSQRATVMGVVHFGANLLSFRHGCGNGGIGSFQGHVVHGKYFSTAGFAYTHCHYSFFLAEIVKCCRQWRHEARRPSKEFRPCLRRS